MLNVCSLITVSVPLTSSPVKSLGLLLLGYDATGIGLASSSFARSALQAVMLVPLILIPQILFSGFTVQTDEMGPFVLAVAHIMPSFAAERISDTSLLFNQKICEEVTS